MIEIHDNGLFEIFPAIKTITEAFEDQNSMLNKIVLTGKINALDIAENLFDFTEKTADTFASLQENIIETLLDENKKAIMKKANLKLNTILHILMKNVYEVVKSIDLLIEESDVIAVLKGDKLGFDLKDDFVKFIEFYDNYSDVLLINLKGEILVNANERNKVSITKDNFIDEIINAEGAIYTYKKTDMIIFEKASFLVGKKVVDEDNNILGVVVINFNLKSLMNSIFDKILNAGEMFILVDKFNNLIISSEAGISNKYFKSINKENEAVIVNSKFNLKRKIPTYNNFKVDGYAIFSLKREKDLDLNILLDKDKNNSIKDLMDLNIKNKDLKKLTDEAYSILEDLSDVIINGELIAAKSKQYILIPILDNLREVSFRVVKLIEVSISSLQNIISASIKDSVSQISKFIVFSIMNNLAQIISDVKWFSLNKAFISGIENKEETILKNELNKIKAIYTNYYDICVYDNSGKILASTQDISGEIEDRFNIEAGKFNYVYKESKFFNNKKTFIFYSSINHNNKTIGGVCITYDMKEITDMLHFILENTDGFAFILNEYNEIIASTIEKDKISKLKFDLNSDKYQEITFEDKHYILVVNKYYNELNDFTFYVVVAIEK